MSSKASPSQGCQLTRGNGVSGASTVYTLIAELTTWSGPNETAKQVDVTSLDSTHKEYIGGLVDGGEVSFDMQFVGSDAQQQGLRADMVARTKRDFKLTLNDQISSTPTIIVFTAVVVSFGMKGSVDNSVMASCALKMTGAPTITYAA